MPERKNPIDKTSTQHTSNQQMKIANSLRDTLAVLNSNRDLNEILEYIVSQAQEILEADAVAIYTPQGEKGILQIQASLGLAKDYIQDAKIPLGSLATGYATMTRKPVSINNLEKFFHQPDIPMDEERAAIISKLGKYYQSVLAVPLIFPKGEVYGTLDLYFKIPREFSEEEIGLAKAYADQTILAIENARLRARAEKAAILSERDRLARDLHDTVSQTLFSASLIADVLPQLWQMNPDNGIYALQELRQLSKGALAEMRTLLIELRPTALLNAELDQLVQQLVDAFISRNRIKVQYEHHPIDCLIPAETKVNLYRITQEALNNIQKHANCSEVKIYLGKDDPRGKPCRRSVQHCKSCNKRIRLTIIDNGCGFIQDLVKDDHMGLRIMRERAEEINAEFVVESSEHTGTKINLIW